MAGGPVPIPKQSNPRAWPRQVHRNIAWFAGLVVAWNIAGALYAWTNAALLTDVEGTWWTIRDAFLLPIVLVFPLAIYGIAVAKTQSKPFGFLQDLSSAKRSRGGLSVFLGTSLFLAGWISGMIGVIAGGNVELRDGRYVTTNHGKVTGDSSREAYLFTKWMFSAAGCCVAGVFCGFGGAAAMAAAARPKATDSTSPDSPTA